MEIMSALEPRHPVLCPERVLFDMQVGAWLVETIRAGGHVRRANRPDTRPHLTITDHIKNVLLRRSHPHRTKRTLIVEFRMARFSQFEIRHVHNIGPMSNTCLELIEANTTARKGLHAPLARFTDPILDRTYNLGRVGKEHRGS